MRRLSGESAERVGRRQNAPRTLLDFKPRAFLQKYVAFVYSTSSDIGIYRHALFTNKKEVNVMRITILFTLLIAIVSVGCDSAEVEDAPTTNEPTIWFIKGDGLAIANGDTLDRGINTSLDLSGSEIFDFDGISFVWLKNLQTLDLLGHFSGPDRVVPTRLTLGSEGFYGQDGASLIFGSEGMQEFVFFGTDGAFHSLESFRFYVDVE